MDQLTKEFLAESQEGLDRMEVCIAELERRPNDHELISEMFRAVHTIKGATGFLGYQCLEILSHAGEGLLGGLRDGSVPVSARLVDALLELMDRLRSILKLIESSGGEGQRSSDSDGPLLARLAELGSKVQERPTISASVPPPNTEPPSPGNARKAWASAEAPAASATIPADQAAFVEVSPPTPPAPRDSAVAPSDQTLRIDVEVLNRMMNLVGDLVLTRNQILQSAPGAENFPELARRLDSVTADLRESVMQARMQPVGNLFSKFPRIVRDLAQSCGKRVRLEFLGQDTGLDKSLLEAIKDPLTHALRNSIDHGIEAPEYRLRAGKPVEGVVRLRAFQQNGFIVVELADDGAGIPLAEVLSKGIERGLVTLEKSLTMTEHEVMQLIFEPGFSTAHTVTSISGRGVGMDVVRTNVERVGGSVEVESQAGKGTTLRLRVPLTLAIIPALVVRSGGQSFALPQSTLIELVYVPRDEFAQAVARIGTAELYRLRDRLLPLVWLDRLLGLGTCQQSHGFYIAVLEGEGCRYGLVVDELMAPEEIVVKPLSPVLREIGLFSGATVLGNGLLAMILDVGATGAIAGVRSMADPEAARNAAVGLHRSVPADAVSAEINSMVIYESGLPQESYRGLSRGGDGQHSGERTAMPLSLVERIESLPFEDIESVEGRPVLQYRGRLLALSDEGGLLGEMKKSDMATILICRQPVSQVAGELSRGHWPVAPALGGQRVGVLVRRVVGVVSGPAIGSDTPLNQNYVATLNGRATKVQRELPPILNSPPSGSIPATPRTLQLFGEVA